MNNEDIMAQIKFNLACTLEKAGSSLEEFEDSLANKDLEKIGNDVVKLIGDLMAKSPELYFGSALGVGAGGGYLAHLANKHLEDQDGRFREKEDALNRLKLINSRINNEYGLTA